MNTENNQQHNSDTDNLTEDTIAANLNTDENISGSQNLDTAPDDDSNSGSGSNEVLQQELSEAKDKYLRLMAEFDNFRRRNAKEAVELRMTAGRDIIVSLLDVLDDTNRAAAELEKTEMPEAAKSGVLLVFNKLRNTLTSKGLKAMEANGTDFDPELHEAITEIPAPTPEMAGKVIDVVQPGYYLNEKLIRHAKVVVGK